MMDTFSCNSFEPNQTHDDHDHQEESGWTTYLDDFSNQYRTRSQRTDHQDKSSSSFSVSPSLVSDAANDSYSDKNIPVNNFPAQLKFKKARTKKICQDHSLEDTASSPVNSPKVSQFERIQTPPRKIEDFASSSFVMGNIGGMRDNQIQIQEDDEQRMTMMRDMREDNNNNNNNNNNNMDLRSRGLCVVPMSMLANFNSRF